MNNRQRRLPLLSLPSDCNDIDWSEIQGEYENEQESNGVIEAHSPGVGQRHSRPVAAIAGTILLPYM
jgi:hypothetical protein